MLSAHHHDPRRSQRIGSEADTEQSSSAAGLTQRDVIARHLQELYAFNRGALYANSLVEAQAAFEQGDFAKAFELVKASSELFEKRHRKTLEQDPKRPDGKRRVSRKERHALENKQARIKEILDIFDAVLRPLQKMVRLQRLGRPRPAAESSPAGRAQPGARLPKGFREEYAAAKTNDARYQVICKHFHIEPVSSEQHITPDTIYYVRGKEGHLIRSSPGESSEDLVSMTVVLSGQPMKPIARQDLLELGRKSQLLRLLPKAPEKAAREASSAVTDQRLAEAGIDMGSFTQLLTAAQQSGIVPGADQIAHVRDREFRMGKYHSAFDTIDRLRVKFNQAAAQREQKLRAEEIAYKSGTLKMSPKQWQLKKQRDTMQTQKIERARRNFARILDGLRILVASR